ncbi:hypothetical protein BG015_009823 [Linnemannia schmuckeri]|uniref:Transcription activator GCR1-like domain-containing protein n=1 Tax=Linnemannia schmuckeri TaxID=64567 RepID=A0A9P5S5A8_9FUNG|nr:hypothetical protein BG015_009823 [Linnemannia schmuckeri]
MNNDLITKHFIRKREAEEDHGDYRKEQGSPRRQRQPPPAPLVATITTAEDEAAIQRLVALAAKANDPAVPASFHQSVSQGHDHLSIRKVFSSLVTVLDRHNDTSSQTPSFQETCNEDPLQTAIASEGVLLWREFCISRAYDDDDRVTPEKLLDYVDLICLPYDNLQQRKEIISNLDGSYPLLVLSLQALVRPVLQLWVHKGHPLDADMEFSQQAFTEGSIAEEEEREGNGQDDRSDTDYQSETWCDMPRDADLARGLDELEDEDIDWSKETAVVQENALKPMFAKKKPDSVNILSATATTLPVKHAFSSASALAAPAWKHGRYKANEFKVPTMYNNLRTVDNKSPTPTYNLTLTEYVVELLEEWRFGLDDQMSIQDLNKQYGPRWRRKEQDYYYHVKITIVREFKRLVSEEGMEDDEAVAYLVTKQGTKATETLYNELCQERSPRNKVAGKKSSTLSDPTLSSSSSPKTLSDSETVPSSSGGTSNALISPAKFGKSSAKDVGVMKQATLSPSKGSISDNHATKKEPLTHTATTTSVPTDLMSWRQGFKNKTQYCAPTPGMPEVWDDVTLDRTYRFPIFDDIVAVDDLWKFWTQGWDGGPSVQERSVVHGATWRKAAYDPTIAQWYAPRYKVVQEIRRLVEQGWSESEAVDGIEALRRDFSMEGLAKHLASLNDIPVAISDATNPDAHTTMVAQARSAALSNAASGSGLTSPMGHVGGRCAPRSRHLQATTAIQEPLTEEVIPPIICGREDLAITVSQFNGRTGGRFESTTSTTTSGAHSRGTETVSLPRTAGNRRPAPSGSSSSSSLSRRRRSRSDGAGTPLDSVSVSKYMNNQRRPRIQVKKEDRE